LVLATGSAVMAAPQVNGQEPSPAEMQELRAAASTPDAAARIAAVKKFLAAHPKSPLAPIAQQIILGSLVESKAPTADILAAGDAALAALPEGPERSDIYNTLAFELAQRGEQLDKANEYAQKALAGLPPGDQFKELR